MICDNVQATHDPFVISDDKDALRVGCKQCNQQFVLRKDYRGVPNNREYSKIFKRDVLQGNDNLFYKYYDTNLRT